MSFDLVEFVKKNYRILAFFFIVYFFVYFSLLRAGVSYTDDVVREITGWSLFLTAGRPVTEFIVMVIFGGHPVVDISPIFQLSALFLLATASLVFFYDYKNEKRSWILLPALVIGLNPFVIENLGYKLDSAFMFLALLFAIFPLYKFRKNTHYIILGSFYIFVCLSTYQAALGAFLIIIFHRLIRKICLGTNSADLLKQFIIDASPLVVGTLAYQFMLSSFMTSYFDQSSWAKTHSQTIPLHNFFVPFGNNVFQYISQFYVDWSKTVVGWVAALLLIYFVLVCFADFIRHRQNIEPVLSHQKLRWFANSLARSTLLIFALLGFFLSPGGLQFFLSNPVFVPRTLYTFGLLFAFVMVDNILLTNSSVIRRLIISANFYLFILFTTICALFGNLLIQQAEWENLKYPSLINDISSAMHTKSTRRVQFYGYIGYAPRVNVAIQKFPYLPKVLRYYIGNIWSFAATLSTIGLTRIELVHELDMITPMQIEELPKTNLFHRDSYRVFYTNKGYILVMFN